MSQDISERILKLTERTHDLSHLSLEFQLPGSCALNEIAANMDVMQQRQRAVELREVAETTVILEFDALRVVTASIYESILSIRRDEMASMEVRNRPLTPLQTQVLVNAMSFGLFDQIGRIDVRRLSAILGTEPTALRRTLIDAETRIAARFLQELEKSQS